MASTSASATTDRISWTISGLSSDWNKDNYQSAYVQIYHTSSGSYVGSGSPVYPPSTGKNRSVSGSYSGGSLIEGETYTVRGYAVTNAAYSAGSTTVTMKMSRPSDFTSFGSLSKGDSIISASLWESFTSRINQFRRYKGLNTTSFTAVRSGIVFTAGMFNEARAGINSMNPPISVPSSQSSGNEVYVSLFHSLQNSLNSIR